MRTFCPITRLFPSLPDGYIYRQKCNLGITAVGDVQFCTDDLYQLTPGGGLSAELFRATKFQYFVKAFRRSPLTVWLPSPTLNPSLWLIFNPVEVELTVFRVSSALLGGSRCAEWRSSPRLRFHRGPIWRIQLLPRGRRAPAGSGGKAHPPGDAVPGIPRSDTPLAHAHPQCLCISAAALPAGLVIRRRYGGGGRAERRPPRQRSQLQSISEPQI